MRDELWEICCSPTSFLAAAAMRVGLRTKRINLANGYDLYRPQTYPDLTKLALECRPRLAWVVFPAPHGVAGST